ncbi:hypothetical protein VKT23_010825 [Stygiomarasmius scandens]|uniref:Ribonuclease H1 N-terminal domain-containing protein n=1 Tax=Marasmiellus scandens TaxID=2682957 RepID=A0ABR1JCY7_9AGAR
MSNSVSGSLLVGERVECPPFDLESCLSTARLALDQAVVAYDRLCHPDAATSKKNAERPVFTDSEDTESDDEIPPLDLPDCLDLTVLAGLLFGKKQWMAIQLVQRLLVVSPSADATLALMAWTTTFLLEAATDNQPNEDDIDKSSLDTSVSSITNSLAELSVSTTAADVPNIPFVPSSSSTTAAAIPNIPLVRSSSSTTPTVTPNVPASQAVPTSVLASVPTSALSATASASPADNRAPVPLVVISDDEEDLYPFADDDPDYAAMYGTQIPPPPPALSPIEATCGPCYLVTPGRPLNSTLRGRGYGVYRTWGETSPRVLGVSFASFNRYDTLSEAWSAYAIARDNGVLQNLS